MERECQSEMPTNTHAFLMAYLDLNRGIWLKPLMYDSVPPSCVQRAPSLNPTQCIKQT